MSTKKTSKKMKVSKKVKTVLIEFTEAKRMCGTGTVSNKQVVDFLADGAHNKNFATVEQLRESLGLCLLGGGHWSKYCENYSHNQS